MRCTNRLNNPHISPATMVSPYLKAISLMEYSVPKNSQSNIILAVSIKQKKSGSRTKNLKKGFIMRLLIRGFFIRLVR
jgi:hypothetical protein